MPSADRKACGAKNADLFSYEVPRKGNPFETTVYAWDTGEASCERAAGHKGQHFITHQRTILEFTEVLSETGH